MSTVDADDILRNLVLLLKKKRMRASDLFKKIDASGDGSLEGPELREGLKNLGLETTDDEFEVVMARIDKDGGGDVSLKEFDRALKAAEKLPPKKKEEAPKKKQGLTDEDREEFRQIFCLFKQLCRQRASEAANDDSVELIQWDDGGSIQVDELETLLETVGLHIEQRDVEQMIAEIDLDGNGEIDFQEFCTTMTKKIQVEYEPEEIRKSFKSFARNAPDGLIKVHDLREALKTYMHKDMIDSEVDALLLHYKDSFFTPAGSDQEYFNYQDYIDLMSPLTAAQAGP
mmetsp:Transcript_5535/g.7826  ORF Transcript_5535/g.7826 Transcript_5535/m.7826 type:complete len:286 (+) Transcript_5535:69-926(+)|eukprot:CAMPEP_0206458500 /NCGR_PEP_ID=MMETSP0324_2-20121206/23609_1 /ASSEMBLY_ACC=CAM_ASM_000836 /TAXON_ID=2866 /ORGANISM="Crypthecodinium cohnii, Strain Seligo" /LENGTH=285 /DNA_ID=CAMNT_0053929855 /DNA_START=49 /DNA_END=906 /DNA_ORIENTATION=+